MGVVISPERHEELLAALEELEDVRAFDEAMAEEGANIPWEDVEAMWTDEQRELSVRDSLAFAEAPINPPTPSDALRAARDRYFAEVESQDT